MDPPLRETMLVKGDVDAITGFLLHQPAQPGGTWRQGQDLSVQLYPQYGVKLYGNAIIAGEDFLKKNPEAVKAFLRAFSKGTKAVIADPQAAVAMVKARDGIIDEKLDVRRLSWPSIRRCPRPTHGRGVRRCQGHLACL